MQALLAVVEYKGLFPCALRDRSRLVIPLGMIFARLSFRLCEKFLSHSCEMNLAIAYHGRWRCQMSHITRLLSVWLATNLVKLKLRNLTFGFKVTLSHTIAQRALLRYHHYLWSKLCLWLLRQKDRVRLALGIRLYHSRIVSLFDRRIHKRAALGLSVALSIWDSMWNIILTAEKRIISLDFVHYVDNWATAPTWLCRCLSLRLCLNLCHCISEMTGHRIKRLWDHNLWKVSLLHTLRKPKLAFLYLNNKFDARFWLLFMIFAATAIKAAKLVTNHLNNFLAWLQLLKTHSTWIFVFN